ncbi:cold-shock protein [Novimethylophilus kurashikiensis]|uniref:Cold-shock protein n=1 Tax=Novimethylophilus kurashikiensis TaxID=1825523 RepID=A0A2R5FCR3_9PROT|nr:HPF/RaiA family ribosome-associated protein [Novimethylophilus kurashikiensis]GBG14723.1 cold-shock protein [Novimethylophilus kurashikiensis]
MQIPLQITIRDIPPSQALEANIREKVAKLGSLYDHILSCRVVVEMPHKHHHQGKHFNVRLDLGMPGRAIVVNRDHHEDVYVALRDAFDAARRQVQSCWERLRRTTKSHVLEYIGAVSEINHIDGFGFIVRPDDGTRLYFHRDNVIAPHFSHLKPGDEVKFIESTAIAAPQAKRVSVGKHRLM